MERPQTTFDAPQFELVPDAQGPRLYANVDNQLLREYAADKRRAQRQVPIVIPASLFTLMKEALKIDPSESVTLYLVDDGDYFVFGLAWGTHGVADLWSYTATSLPVFLR